MSSFSPPDASATPVLRPKRDRLGLPFLLLLLYPVYDYGRPDNPMGIPMIISALLLLAWILAPAKKMTLYTACSILFLGVMAIGALTATNNFSAYVATEAMVLILLCTCYPLIQFIDSPRKIRIFLNALILVFVYVGIWTIVSGGRAPGWQDENYAAAMMCVAIPMAYFSIPISEHRIVKGLHGIAIGIFVTALIASESRGGFVGLVGIVLFCVLYSPRKKQALIALTIGTLLAVMVAGPKYWDDMASITDTKEATADMRLELWTIAWRMFLHNPLIGVGPGNYQWRIGEYQSVEQLDKFGRVLTESVVVHSTYFEILSELGIAGLGLFAAILIRALSDLRRIISGVGSEDRRAKRTLQETTSEREPRRSAELRQLRYLGLAIMGAIVGFLVPAAFISFAYNSLFWLLVALAVALNEVASRTPGSPTTGLPPRHPNGCE